MPFRGCLRDLSAAAGRPDLARSAYELVRPLSTRSAGDIQLALLNAYIEHARVPAP